MNVKVSRLDPATGEFVPWEFVATETAYMYSTCNLSEDPTTYSTDDRKFSTPEEARAAGLSALDKMDEGILSIWRHDNDPEGNGESEILLRYRRDKTGPSKTIEVDLNTDPGFAYPD